MLTDLPLSDRIASLLEGRVVMGARGCRLVVLLPEIAAAQTEAVVGKICYIYCILYAVYYILYTINTTLG
jgi:hypothetical protein